MFVDRLGDIMPKLRQHEAPRANLLFQFVVSDQVALDVADIDLKARIVLTKCLERVNQRINCVPPVDNIGADHHIKVSITHFACDCTVLCDEFNLRIVQVFVDIIPVDFGAVHGTGRRIVIV